MDTRGGEGWPFGQVGEGDHTVRALLHLREGVGLLTLNFWEWALINNPVRALVQRQVEAPRLLRLGGRLDGKDVLEVGCGSGVGVDVIFQSFGATTVTGLDVDPRMIALAKTRLASLPAERLSLAVGSATAIEAPDQSFDAVFEFGVLHHVPNWQRAVREIARVLKPGGLFYFEDVTKQALNRWVYRTFLDHPADNRFDGRDFAHELERSGIILRAAIETFLWSDFFIGVGQRRGTNA